TCAAVQAGGAVADGAYWLALPSGEAAPVWCDLTTDGGGWTLGFVRNTASVGNQGDFGAGHESLDALGASPAAASASSTPALGWIDLEAYPWSELRVAAYASGAETFGSRLIDRDDLRIPFGSDGYYLYGGPTGYYWCGGDASYTDGGVGAVDNPEGAPADCKGHGSLGSGWDFSESPYVNAGLTLCGADGSSWLHVSWGGTYVGYGAAGGAQALWVR
ncbi:MAG: fibrinogen-like YCDxxxxGGGW domain-containing protein, partial [Myxococcota bacterium]